jgi:hypothetical protein
MDGAKLLQCTRLIQQGPSAVAICAVIGGNARKPGVGRLTVEQICLRASLRRRQIATAAIRSIGAVFSLTRAV